mmetsp:Transcript_90605/g.251958  ORF Transcript_90605/g.251958 Transcript_90605/m.251958 type:complete len:261 (+) Transcript_90605:527-1309(+)
MREAASCRSCSAGPPPAAGFAGAAAAAGAAVAAAGASWRWATTGEGGAWATAAAAVAAAPILAVACDLAAAGSLLSEAGVGCASSVATSPEWLPPSAAGAAIAGATTADVAGPAAVPAAAAAASACSSRGGGWKAMERARAWPSAARSMRSSFPDNASISSRTASGSLLPGVMLPRGHTPKEPRAPATLLLLRGRLARLAPSAVCELSSSSSASSTALLSAFCCAVTRPTSCKSSVTVCCFARTAFCNRRFLRRRMAASR